MHKYIIEINCFQNILFINSKIVRKFMSRNTVKPLNSGLLENVQFFHFSEVKTYKQYVLEIENVSVTEVLLYIYIFLSLFIHYRMRRFHCECEMQKKQSN